ncbi:MAG: hypothetical protein ACJAX3_001457 [Patiriisocius sp.]|jgi:bla regulator protein BlaR1
MLHYIIQVLAFQLLFLMAYDLFLKKETFFQWNRVYLIATSVLSFVVPFLKVGAISRAIPQEYMVQLPTVLLGDLSTSSFMTQGEEVFISTKNAITFWNFSEILLTIWGAGTVIATGLLVFKIYKVSKLKKKGILSETKGINIVVLPETDVAFSFLNTVFIGAQISETHRKDVLLHEEIHIKQRHTLDLLLFELLRIVAWFNPLVYVFQNRMEALHEYIADSGVAKQKEDVSYYETLLAQVFKTEKISFINTFFNHSLIKKRIIMLQKSKSNRLFQLKYLVLIPMVFGMLIYTSCTSETSVSENNSLTEKIADLTAEIEIKETMTKEERQAFVLLVKKATMKKIGLVDKNGKVEYNTNFDYIEDKLEIEGGLKLKTMGVPFGVIDKAPTYPGCTGTNAELKKCLSQSLSSFVGENFNTKVAPKELTGAQQIYVQFMIDTNGEVSDLKARAPHPSLKEEALRVVSSIPTMQPGEQDGKQVGVLYSLPIKFEINE